MFALLPWIACAGEAGGAPDPASPAGVTTLHVRSGLVRLENSHGSRTLEAGQSARISAGRAPLRDGAPLEDLLPPDLAGLLVYSDFWGQQRQAAEWPLTRLLETAVFKNAWREREGAGDGAEIPGGLPFHPLQIGSSHRFPRPLLPLFGALGDELRLAWRRPGAPVVLASLRTTAPPPDPAELTRALEWLARECGLADSMPAERVGEFEIQRRGNPQRSLAWALSRDRVVFGKDGDLVRSIVEALAWGPLGPPFQDRRFEAYRKRLASRDSDTAAAPVSQFLFLSPSLAGEAGRNLQALPPWMEWVRDSGPAYLCGHARTQAGVTRGEWIFGHPLVAAPAAPPPSVRGAAPKGPTAAASVFGQLSTSLPLVLWSSRLPDLLAVLSRLSGTPLGKPFAAWFGERLGPLIPFLGEEAFVGCGPLVRGLQEPPDLLLSCSLRDLPGFLEALQKSCAPPLDLSRVEQRGSLRLYLSLMAEPPLYAALDLEAGFFLLSNSPAFLQQALAGQGADRPQGVPLRVVPRPWWEAFSKEAGACQLALALDLSRLSEGNPALGERALAAVGIPVGAALYKAVRESPLRELFVGLSQVEDGLKLVTRHGCSVSPWWEVLLLLGGGAERRQVRQALAPIQVEWAPGDPVLYADGTQVVLVRQPGTGLQGKSADNAFRATLNSVDELVVTDQVTGRTARRLPDGAWIHRFGRTALEVDAAGGVVVRLPNGRSGVAERLLVARPVIRTRIAPELRWALGVRLEGVVEERLLVRGVDPGSPAARAGVLPGDELLQFDGRKYPGREGIGAFLKTLPYGTPMQIRVRRGGAMLTLHAVSGAWD